MISRTFGIQSSEVLAPLPADVPLISPDQSSQRHQSQAMVDHDNGAEFTSSCLSTVRSLPDSAKRFVTRPAD
jgi:hypothetical protein